MLYQSVEFFHDPEPAVGLVEVPAMLPLKKKTEAQKETVGQERVLAEPPLN